MNVKYNVRSHYTFKYTVGCHNTALALHLQFREARKLLKNGLSTIIVLRSQHSISLVRIITLAYKILMLMHARYRTGELLCAAYFMS